MLASEHLFSAGLCVSSPKDRHKLARVQPLAATAPLQSLEQAD